METKQPTEREQQEMKTKQKVASEQSDDAPDNTIGENVSSDKRKILERIWTFCLQHKPLAIVVSISVILSGIATFYNVFFLDSSDPGDGKETNAPTYNVFFLDSSDPGDGKEINAPIERAPKSEELEAEESPYALVIDRAIVAAYKLHQDGQIDDSIKKWNCIANISEEIDDELAAIALFVVGNLHSEKKEITKAISSYNDAIRRKSDFVDAYINRGNMKKQLGENKKAITDYSKAIDLKPDSAIAYYNRGLTHFLLNEHEKATSDYSMAIHLKPNLSKAYTNRGNLYSQVGDYKKAIDDYNVAIGLKPDSVEAYFNRGYAKYQLGKYQKAASDYTVVIGLKPDHAKAHANRGAVKVALGNIEGARADFQNALRLARRQGKENMKSEMERQILELNNMK